jgi:hypothetical protein
VIRLRLSAVSLQSHCIGYAAQILSSVDLILPSAIAMPIRPLVKLFAIE